MRKGFISYAHADKDACLAVRKHLTSLRQAQIADFWVDEDIRVGDVFHDEIRDALLASEIIIMLVSPDFIWSDYIEAHERPLIIQRRDAGAVVVPIILTDCLWSVLEFSTWQALPPPNAKPLDEWDNPNKALANSARKILEKLQSLDSEHAGVS